MGLFSKKKKNADLMAICLGYDGLYSASIRHDFASLPALEFLSFYPKSNQNWDVLLNRLARETPVKQKQRTLLLQYGEYQLFSLESMNVPVEEMKSAVRWKLKDLLDYSSEEATYDVLHVPGDINQGNRNQSMIAVVARNQQIMEKQNLFESVNLSLDVIDIPEMAQRNISARLEQEGRGLAMLSFDQGGGLLTVTFGGELYLSRRLDVGLGQLNIADENERNAVFGRISLELQRSLDHFDRQHNYITTAKLMLAPLGQVAEQLQQFLAVNMYMPVEILNLDQVINLSQVPELKDPARQQVYFGILGAALRREEGTT